MRLTFDRKQRLRELIAIYGYRCFLECGRPFTEKDPPSIDHWWPQSWCRAQGWTQEQIDDISNTRICHRTCNSRKSDRIPLDDYTLGPVPIREPKAAKLPRPEHCETCFSGRLLLVGETCHDCGIGPQPSTIPKTLQRRPKECDHGQFICVRCFVWEPEIRISAFQMIIMGS